MDIDTDKDFLQYNKELLQEHNAKNNELLSKMAKNNEVLMGSISDNLERISYILENLVDKKQQVSVNELEPLDLSHVYTTIMHHMEGIDRGVGELGCLHGITDAIKSIGDDISITMQQQDNFHKAILKQLKMLNENLSKQNYSEYDKKR